jgi:hypothetical protein
MDPSAFVEARALWDLLDPPELRALFLARLDPLEPQEPREPQEPQELQELRALFVDLLDLPDLPDLPEPQEPQAETRHACLGRFSTYVERWGSLGRGESEGIPAQNVLR